MLLYPSRPVLDVSDLCQDTQPSRGQPSFRVLPASYSSRRAQRMKRHPPFCRGDRHSGPKADAQRRQSSSLPTWELAVPSSKRVTRTPSTLETMYRAGLSFGHVADELCVHAFGLGQAATSL